MELSPVTGFAGIAPGFNILALFQPNRDVRESNYSRPLYMLDGLRQVRKRALCVAIQHMGAILEEERVFQA